MIPKLLGASLMVIWIAGTAVTYIYDASIHRKACINEEGSIKGLLWCSKDHLNHVDLSITSTSNMISAAMWPYRSYRHLTHSITNEY